MCNFRLVHASISVRLKPQKIHLFEFYMLNGRVKARWCIQTEKNKLTRWACEIKCRLMPCTIFFVFVHIDNRHHDIFVFFVRIWSWIAVYAMCVWECCCSTTGLLQLCNMVYRMDKMTNTKHIFYAGKLHL